MNQITPMNPYQNETEAVCARAKAASAALARASGKTRADALSAMRDALISDTQSILQANALDMEHAAENGVAAPMRDRLRLDETRLTAIADALGALAALPDPIGTGEVFTRPNGIQIRRVRVPLGVVGMIYEARPNVTADAAGLCIKSGNAAILRGGKEAILTNTAMVKALKRGLSSVGLPADALGLITDTARESAQQMMQMRTYLDVLIPRGGRGLIRAVTENARVPVIETGAGNCHLYVDADADLDMALSLTMNAKTQRPAVCNAIETLLVHKDAAGAFLPMIGRALSDFHTPAGVHIPVEIRGCERVCALLPYAIPACEEDWVTEYDDYILSVRVVDSIEDAIAHINRCNTGHSEAIVTKNLNHAAQFQREVDAACVYVNASTRFTDGGEFGFGAEIGISTQKLHARGPMGLDALTTVKYLIDGTGQVRT